MIPARVTTAEAKVYFGRTFFWSDFGSVLDRWHPSNPNHDALAEAMEDAMGAAVVNGAAKGALKRKLTDQAAR